MKDKIINKALLIIKKNSLYLDKEKIDTIKYGLEGIYLTFTKFIILIAISLILGIFKEVILLSVFYNIIRFVAFGIHASKSSYCLISSLIMFIGGSYLCMYVTIPYTIKIVLSILSVLLLFKYAPADTIKRPIINKKRRFVYKILSSSFGLIFALIIIIVSNNEFSQFMLIGMVEACIMILPITYKIFNLPYNNYKNYNYGLSN